VVAASFSFDSVLAIVFHPGTGTIEYVMPGPDAALATQLALESRSVV